MKLLPDSVNICECWARDGIQGEAAFIPTETKVEMINSMTKLGFKRLEVTSFSHPKLVRQFSDAVEVLKGIDRPPDVSYIAIIPNEKALDRALDCGEAGHGVHEITAIISASEAHLLANLERTMDEVKPSLARIVKRAGENGIKVIGCVGTAFGCPLAGDVPVSRIVELTDWYLEQGADYIMLGDTTGEANPLQVRRVYGEMLDRFPGVDFIAHFHDTRGMGVANTLAALEQGVVYHDCSLGGIGGQPATNRPKYHYGLTGNTCTEDMLTLMDEIGVETGLNLEDVIDLTLRAEEISGRELMGRVTRSGPVRHRSPKTLLPDQLRPGRKIPPSLHLYLPEKQSPLESPNLVEKIVTCALDNCRPLPAGLSMDTGDIRINGFPEKRSVFLTRFSVLETDPAVVLEAVCQKSDGEMVFEGPVRLLFEGIMAPGE